VFDRVFADLADEGLAGLEHLLDLGLAPATLEVVLVDLDVAPVQHGVLRGADVDERRLHAGQDVLDPPEVDVAVDLGHGAAGAAPARADRSAGTSWPSTRRPTPRTSPSSKAAA
jgi:hypothetical protein